MQIMLPITRNFHWLLLILVSTLVPYAQVSAEWSTTQFEVVQSEPDSLLDALPEMLKFVDLDKNAVAEIEKFLAEVAREYEYLGFREPALDHKSSDNQAYQVFVFDFTDDVSPAGYSKFCNDKRYIRIDSSRIMKAGKIDPKYFGFLAHELFHAVQASYPLFSNNCNIGDWITEGTAEAVGIDTAFKLRKVEPPAFRIRWGGRVYFTPLRVADDDMERKDEAYWTSSLWRYIGERANAGGGRPGTKYIPADYRYLGKLFSRDLSGPVGVTSELDWLDDGLAAITGLGLDRIYPNFVTTFASYIPARGKEQKNAEVWRNWLFDTCPKVSLSLSQKTAVVGRGLKEVTAGCFELNIAIPDRVDIALQVEGIGLEGLKSLSIGTAEGTKVGKATIIEDPARPGQYFGTWLFRVPTNAPQVFVISNVAPKASETKRLTPIVKISLSSWQSNMTKAKPQAQPAKNTGGTGNTQPDPTARKTAEELKSGVNSLSAHVAGGATTHLHPDKLPCQDAFIYDGCGPSTTIQLSLMPGSMGHLGYVTGTGGMLAQIMGTFSGMAAAGSDELGSNWIKSAEAMANMDGAEVNIVIPLIDYGYSGTFNNASITVSGAGNAIYQAKGPRDGIPGADIAFPLSGKVSIEEYTPFSMRGNFSAQLVDMNNIPPFISKDPVLPVHTNIHGSFNIVNAWRGDRRAKVVTDTASLEADMQETFPAVGQNGTTLFQQSQDTQSSSVSPTGGPSSGTGPGHCDCSCNQANKPQLHCESTCGSTYAACAGIKHEAPIKTDVEITNEKAEFDELREKFRVLLESLSPGDSGKDARKMMMDIFDKKQSLNEKRMMIMSYGGKF